MSILAVSYYCRFQINKLSLLLPLFFCHRGLLPADADYNLLDVARRLEMYGVTLYAAKVRHCSLKLLFGRILLDWCVKDFIKILLRR